MNIKLLGAHLRALRESEYIYGVHNPLTYDFLHHNLHHLHVLLFHSADQQDFTRGPILRQLLIFMLPILLSQLLQQFYGIADTARSSGRHSVQRRSQRSAQRASSSPSSSTSSSASLQASASSSRIFMERKNTPA